MRTLAPVHPAHVVNSDNRGVCMADTRPVSSVQGARKAFEAFPEKLQTW
jgi:hypothetical protein